MIVSYRLAPGAQAPIRSSAGAAAWDLTVTRRTQHQDYVEYGTGLFLAIPPGWCGKIYPRSSVSNFGLHLSNAVGVIDSDYRGEILVRFYLVTPNALGYEIGQRCAQLMFERVSAVEWQQVDELPETVRGTGGFGWTGK